ncbi:hypothetical protein JOD51_001907 [Curtobacterium herbarum]|nr:hypothetical protein [Curtobacterium herbarum]
MPLSLMQGAIFRDTRYGCEELVGIGEQWHTKSR